MAASSHIDKFNIHKLGTPSPKQRNGQLRSSKNQLCPLKVTTVTGCFIQNVGSVTKLLSIFWVYIKLKNFGLGLRKFLLGLCVLGLTWTPRILRSLCSTLAILISFKTDSILSFNFSNLCDARNFLVVSSIFFFDTNS